VSPHETGVRRGEVAAYFGLLLLTIGLADPQGLVHVRLLYTLKDELGTSPSALAVFDAITMLPVYCGIAFGILRDRWSPFRLGDTGYLLLAAPAAVFGYIWLATAPRVSYAALLAVVLLISVAFQFMETSAHALVAGVAQRLRMTGRLSALAELAEVAPKAIAFAIGGWIVANCASSIAYFGAAALAATIVIPALWRPRAVFAAAPETTDDAASVAFMRRLLGARGLGPTIAILFLWNFAPGWATPFLYYLSDQLHATPTLFGICKATTLAAIGTAAVAYAWLCHGHGLGRMLRLSVWVNAVAGLLFLVIADAPQAVAICAVVGLATGLGNVAVFDLLLRACPRKLEGTATTLGYAAFAAADVAGDLLGAVLYERFGFAPCVLLDVVATLSILLLLARLPHLLVATSEDSQDHSTALPT
jgi:hypothetical protein